MIDIEALDSSPASEWKDDFFLKKLIEHYLPIQSHPPTNPHKKRHPTQHSTQKTFVSKLSNVSRSQAGSHPWEARKKNFHSSSLPIFLLEPFFAGFPACLISNSITITRRLSLYMNSRRKISARRFNNIRPWETINLICITLRNDERALWNHPSSFSGALSTLASLCVKPSICISRITLSRSHPFLSPARPEPEVKGDNEWNQLLFERMKKKKGSIRDLRIRSTYANALLIPDFIAEESEEEKLIYCREIFLL